MAEEKEEIQEFITDEAELPEDLGKEMDKIVSAEEPDKEDKKEAPAEEKDKEVEEDKEAKDEKETEEKKEEEEFEEIPERLVRSGKTYGWSDEKIIKMAEEDPDLLEHLADAQDLRKEKRTPKGEDKGQDEAEVKYDEFKFDIDQDEVDPRFAEFVEKVTGEINRTRKQGAELQAKLERQSIGQHDRYVDKYFDGRAEDLPELGNLKTLTDDQKGLRREVYGVADALGKSRQLDIEDALDEAVKLYKVDEKTAADKLVTKLNKRKAKFSPRPTRKQSRRKFASKEEEAEYTMGEVYKKAGIEA